MNRKIAKTYYKHRHVACVYKGGRMGSCLPATYWRDLPSVIYIKILKKYIVRCNNNVKIG